MLEMEIGIFNGIRFVKYIHTRFIILNPSIEYIRFFGDVT